MGYQKSLVLVHQNKRDSLSNGFVARSSTLKSVRSLSACESWPPAPSTQRRCVTTTVTLREEMPESICSLIRLKKYFYVLRPLFAIIHIEQGLGIPPVPFEELVDAVAPEPIRAPVVELLTLKRTQGNWGWERPFQQSTISSSANSNATVFSSQVREDPSYLTQVRFGAS